MIKYVGYLLWYGIYSFFVRLPLMLIDLVVKVYQLIAGSLPGYLMFGIKPGESFNNAQLPVMFMRVAIISIFVFALLFVLSAIRVQFQKQDQKSPISVAMKNSLLGVLYIIGIPILLYLFTTIMGILMNLILGGDGVSMGQSIFDSLYDKEWVKKGVTFENWRGINNPNGSFSISYDIYSALPGGAGAQILFMGTFIALATLVPMVMGLLALVSKVFQQFFLFIISPFVVSASVSDDGRRMKQWVEMYASKSFAILGLILGLQVLTVWITRSTQWTNSLSNINIFFRFLLNLGVIVGGAVAVTSLSSVVAAFVGESASGKEAMTEAKSAITGAMSLAAGGFGAKMALGALNKATGAVAKPVKTAMKWTPGGRKFLENVDSKKRINQAYKGGKIGLAERNQQLNQLKAQQQEDKVNKMKLREAKAEDLKLKTTSNDQETANASINENATLNAGSAVANNASGIAKNSQTNKEFLNDLSEKDLNASTFKTTKQMERSSKEALKEDRLETKLTNKINETKKAISNNGNDNKFVNKANEKIKQLESKLEETKKIKAQAIKKAQALDELQRDRLKFYSKDQQEFMKVRNSVSNKDGNEIAYKFNKLLEKENKKN